MKTGKRYAEAMKNVDRAALYDVADAISIVKKNASAKFDETVELHIRTGCDGRHADQQILSLIHIFGRKCRLPALVEFSQVHCVQRLRSGAPALLRLPEFHQK